MKVKFYNQIEDEKLDFAVIVSKSQGKWVYCKHKERDTWEVPGGHREKGETILEAAKRELHEETGATEFILSQVGVYSVIQGDNETFGMLYFADIQTFEELPNMEIEKIGLFEAIPSNLTYPLIQPKLIEQVDRVLSRKADLEN